MSESEGLMVRALLPRLLDWCWRRGWLVSWVESDDTVFFDCYRLDPEQFADAYKEVP